MSDDTFSELKNLSSRQLVEHLTLFRGLSPAYLDVLAESAMRTHFDTGQVIFQKGDPANRFYVLLTGAVVLEVLDEDACIHRVQYLGPQDVLGWSWLFPPYYWHFDAVALEPTDAIFFYGARLRTQCDRDNVFGYELIKRIAQVIISRLQSTGQSWIDARKTRAAATGDMARGAPPAL